MKIATILGARPQFIKAALLSQELRKNHEELIIHTGQHYDVQLSDIFFEEMSIPFPDYNLEVGSGSHAYQTAQIMIKLEKLLIAEEPDLVLLYGDTNSTLAGALTASKLQIPIAHVEAGPRMYDKSVPEEVNRIVTDHLSEILFAPTQKSLENLQNEGLNEGIYLTGDIMFDNYRYFSNLANRKSNILKKLNLAGEKYILATVHRARNTDSNENLKAICDSFKIIAENLTLVLPLHPRTETYLKKYDLYDDLDVEPNIKMVRPLSYFDMLILTKNAHRIVTDSGGLQKEAYFAKVPCITLDSSTGWSETVEDGWNILADDGRIFDGKHIADLVAGFQPVNKQNNSFGDGNSRKKMLEVLDNF